MKFSSFIFNSIAPIYGLFFGAQVKNYKSKIIKQKKNFNILSYKKILDVGCGTGALATALTELGMEVTGVDVAKNMIKVARKKIKIKEIECIEGDVLNTLPFEDDSFPVSIASYVAHGLKKAEREIMYKEMKRVSSEYVIFHDYNKKRRFLTDIIEYLERGDYFYFIKNAKIEMEEHFSSVETIDVDKHAAWYICKV
ncbi:MAG: class I SAM-dependent methyltransferase [Candidatus Izimaplasma sp.]|nr:class I SAM-dependent methyltransferase [Candidatus Izimaplasma bacterium]